MNSHITLARATKKPQHCRKYINTVYYIYHIDTICIYEQLVRRLSGCPKKKKHMLIRLPPVLPLFLSLYLPLYHSISLSLCLYIQLCLTHFHPDMPNMSNLVSASQSVVKKNTYIQLKYDLNLNFK